MKKYYFYIFLLGCLFLFVGCQKTKEQEYSITIPYEFPVSPGDEEWENLISTEEKIKAMQIPEDILKDTTTYALIETMLESNFIFQFFAYEESFSAVESLEENYNVFHELKSRPDYIENLIQIYEKTPILTSEELEEEPETEHFLDVYNLEVLIAFEMAKMEENTEQDWTRVEEIYEKKKQVREQEKDIYSRSNNGFVWFIEKSQGKINSNSKVALLAKIAAELNETGE